MLGLVVVRRVDASETDDTELSKEEVEAWALAHRDMACSTTAAMAPNFPTDDDDELDELELLEEVEDAEFARDLEITGGGLPR
jgi:hypothetical protein